jgi:hypothetical protein
MNIMNIQYFKTFKNNVTFDAFVMESTLVDNTSHISVDWLQFKSSLK